MEAAQGAALLAEAMVSFRSPPTQPESQAQHAEKTELSGAESQAQQAENKTHGKGTSFSVTSTILRSTMRLNRLLSSQPVRPGQIERQTESFSGSSTVISTLSGAEMLHRLDIHLLDELELKSIALVDADCIRNWDAATPLPMRQRCDASMHLPPKTACKLLAEGGRRIGVLSYAWRGSRHPDRSGDTLRALQRFLTEDTRGMRIKAIFWECVRALTMTRRSQPCAASGTTSRTAASSLTAEFARLSLVSLAAGSRCTKRARRVAR